jgi:hypothetical protein
MANDELKEIVGNKSSSFLEKHGVSKPIATIIGTSLSALLVDLIVRLLSR